MAEYINSATQSVDANGNVVFNEAVVKGCDCIIHRKDSGIFTLKGRTNKDFKRFLVIFTGNVSTSTTAGDSISYAIALNGEVLKSTTMTATPTAANAPWSVGTCTYIDVPSCCCATISVVNTGANDSLMSNPNLIIMRDC